jgi:hypothetical protein
MARVQSGAITVIYYDFTAEFPTAWQLFAKLFFSAQKRTVTVSPVSVTPATPVDSLCHKIISD